MEKLINNREGKNFPPRRRKNCISPPRSAGKFHFIFPIYRDNPGGVGRRDDLNISNDEFVKKKKKVEEERQDGGGRDGDGGEAQKLFGKA